MKIHEKYIKRCIELAKNGLGTTYPNPMVGCVVVYNNAIIGEGWHYKAGEPHAEVNAIHSVKNKGLLNKATIYVSLEPCSHFGKTPPCAHLIVEKGIKNVVIGCLDPNELVAGNGVKYLEENGCHVTINVLENECKELNKRFFTFHLKNRPYIILKWAETNDRYIDKLRAENEKKKPTWISNQFSQQMAHKLRADEQAILVGVNTVLTDNPTLTTRSWYGKNPIRLVIDKNARIDKYSNVFNNEAKTVVFNNTTSKTINNIEYITVNFNQHLIPQICAVLHKQNIQSVIVEGGAKTLRLFLESNYWDEALIFKSNTNFKNGVKAPKIEGKIIETVAIGNNELRVFSNR